MISEYVLSKDEIKRINEKYGGYLRTDAEIDTALYIGKGKNLFRKIACLWRAILVGHPFTDGNKRTAIVVALAMLERCNVKVDDPMRKTIASEVRDIASENITDLKKIERRVRYVTERH